MINKALTRKLNVSIKFEPSREEEIFLIKAYKVCLQLDEDITIKENEISSIKHNFQPYYKELS